MRYNSYSMICCILCNLQLYQLTYLSPILLFWSTICGVLFKTLISIRICALPTMSAVQVPASASKCHNIFDSAETWILFSIGPVHAYYVENARINFFCLLVLLSNYISFAFCSRHISNHSHFVIDTSNQMQSCATSIFLLTEFEVD